jgi:transposase-like protein
MDPRDVFCPNIDCPARGQREAGNIGIHSQKDKRYLCSVCKQTFTVTKGSLFYRLRSDPQVVLLVISLLVYGCPVPAIVKAFGLDERTVKSWWQRAGQQCWAVHDHIVGQSQLDLQQVQADEIKVKTQRGTFWMALAMMVPTRLWLGGAVSPKRDQGLIQRLADQIRRVALCRPVLLAVDGLSSYVGAFQAAFRTALPRWQGQTGRPRLIAWPDVAIVQVVKHRLADRLTIDRRIVQGSTAMIKHLLQSSQAGGVINTAFIERLNATFRQRLNCLTRRTRTLAQQAETLTAGMYVLGCVYNFCDYHKSLRLLLWVGRCRHHWVPRTPALAAGLTDHRWTIQELLSFKVPPPRWVPPKQRGRPSKETLRLIQRWCN